jgi:hypothetical protein
MRKCAPGNTPSKINMSSFTRDPAMIARGVEPNHVQTIVRDDLFARRLAGTISMRLERRQLAGEQAGALTTGH